MEGLPEKLNYSKMTVTRILTNVNDRGILTVLTQGEEDYFGILGTEKAWEQGEEVLNKPLAKFTNSHTQRPRMIF